WPGAPPKSCSGPRSARNLPSLPVMAGLDPAIHALRRQMPGPRCARPGMQLRQASGLLQLHLRASLLELGLDLVGFVLVDAFLDRLRRAFDEVLGFLQAETGDGADFLDD